MVQEKGKNHQTHFLPFLTAFSTPVISSSRWILDAVQCNCSLLPDLPQRCTWGISQPIPRETEFFLMNQQNERRKSEWGLAEKRCVCSISAWMETGVIFMCRRDLAVNSTHRESTLLLLSKFCSSSCALRICAFASSSFKLQWNLWRLKKPLFLSLAKQSVNTENKTHQEQA